MNTKNRIIELPLPSTDFSNEAFFYDHGSVVMIKYELQSGAKKTVGGIKFTGTSAFKKTTERCCEPWHIEGAYDTLAEVEDSTWRKETLANVPDRYRSLWNARHFMIYLDSSGCFEVLAESWEVLPVKLND